MPVVQLDPRVFVSSQIRPEDLPGLKDAGFRWIVNNRPDDEEPGQPRAADIDAAARGAGLVYRHIPIATRIDDADALAFARIVREAEGPVLAFCRSGTRSAHLWECSSRLAG